MRNTRKIRKLKRKHKKSRGAGCGSSKACKTTINFKPSYETDNKNNGCVSKNACKPTIKNFNFERSDETYDKYINNFNECTSLLTADELTECLTKYVMHYHIYDWIKKVNKIKEKDRIDPSEYNILCPKFKSLYEKKNDSPTALQIYSMGNNAIGNIYYGKV